MSDKHSYVDPLNSNMQAGSKSGIYIEPPPTC